MPQYKHIHLAQALDSPLHRKPSPEVAIMRIESPERMPLLELQPPRRALSELAIVVRPSMLVLVGRSIHATPPIDDKQNRRRPSTRTPENQRAAQRRAQNI